MHLLRGSLRFLLVFLILLFGAIAILLTAWVPANVHGIKLSVWPITLMARTFTRLFRVRVICDDCERLRRHSGFVFPNHVSFLDIIVLLQVTPMRFLSKAELRNWPLVGQIARAVGTVFVDRADKESRELARRALTQVDAFPPVVLFPEGGIFPPPNRLGPFRYGAFEIVQAGQVPYMPCVLVYDDWELVFWGDESLLQSAWRFASRAEAVTVHLHALHVVHPQPDDDPRQLALETHGAMDAVLKYGENDADVLQAGL